MTYPGDDLCVGEAQGEGDLVAIGRRQILLVEEPLLQLEDLVVSECRSRFALLLALLPGTEHRRRRVTAPAPAPAPSVTSCQFNYHH